MAAAEARALLDQLMGGDRNAALPKGAALPSHNKNKKRKASDGNSLLLPGKRHKSCYDRDICPLYCAWGIDVYDLFVNTKSDLGPNPNKSDEDARKEYLTLPQHEQQRLGFEHLLFHKLGELVQQCDRAVTRNQEKLNKELQRQLQKRGGHDYVIDVDENAVEQLCRNQLLVEDLTDRLSKALAKVKEIKLKEDDLSQQIVDQNKQKQKEREEKEKKDEKEEEGEKEKDGTDKTGDKETKDEQAEDGAEKEDESSKPSDGDATGEKKDVDVGDEQQKGEGTTEDVNDGNKESDGDDPPPPSEPAKPEPPSPAALELGKITMEKQKILVDITSILQQLGPVQESVDNQARQLNHVKSDITTDKTVCDVSGNFMSARDADERIAAHYAGKQYVGWKLVREKFKDLVSKYGRHGPPPPGRGDRDPRGGGGNMMMAPPGAGGGMSRGGDRDRGGPRGGGPPDHRRGRDFYGGGGERGGGRHGGAPMGMGGGGGGGPPPQGGGRGRQRSPSPNRWERHGDRDRDRYGDRSRGDRGRRGSYDDRRGGDRDRYDDRRRGGGNYGGRR